MRHTILALIILTLAVGCRHLPALGEKEPPWIGRPEAAEQSSRFIAAIGVGDAAPSQQSRLHEAEDAARMTLADKVEDYCSSALEEFMRSRPDLAPPGSAAARDFISAVSARTTGTLLRQTVHHETWENSPGGAVYVLYRLPVHEVNRTILREARDTALNRPLFAGSGDAALGELKRFMDSRLRERMARTTREKDKQSPVTGQQSVPRWVGLGHDKDYPTEEFMVAIGLGPDRASAEENARQELFGRLRRRIRSLAASPPDELDGTPLAADLQSLGKEALRPGKDDLPRVEIRKYWFDKITSTFYTMGVLNREETLVRCGKKIRQMARDSEDLFQTARNNHRADNYRTALEEYLLSLRRLQQKVRYELLALAVGRDGPEERTGELPGPTASQIRERLQELVGEFRLHKISGDKQWVPPETVPGIPLTVEVVAGQPAEAVPKMPVRFSFARGTGEMPEHVTTGEEGRATVRLKSVRSTGTSLAVIDCSLALEEVVPGADLGPLQIPSVSFRLILRSPQNTRLALYVDEGIGQEGRCGVQEALRQALEEAGFTLVARERLPTSVRQGELTGAPEAERIREAFGPLVRRLQGEAFVLAVYGHASAELVEQRETSQGTLHFVDVPVTVRVVDLALPSEPTLLKVSVVGREAYAGAQQEAIRRACAKATSMISRQLVRALQRKFGNH